MSRTAPSGPLVELVQLDERHVASVRTTIERQRLRRTVNILHELVMDAVGEQGLGPAGPLFTRFHSVGARIALECGMPLAQPVAKTGIIVPSFLPGGPVLHGRHVGDHDGLPEAYRAIESYATRHGLDPMGGPWESYVVDGRDTPTSADWITDLYLPVRALVAVGRHGTCGSGTSRRMALPVERSIR